MKVVKHDRYGGYVDSGTKSTYSISFQQRASGSLWGDFGFPGITQEQLWIFYLESKFNLGQNFDGKKYLMTN